jgi:hypothetical protein
MNVNIGGTERAIRTTFGVIFAILAIVRLGGTVGVIIFGILALLALVTGISGTCPLYSAFHIDANRKD